MFSNRDNCGVRITVVSLVKAEEHDHCFIYTYVVLIRLSQVRDRRTYVHDELNQTNLSKDLEWSVSFYPYHTFYAYLKCTLLIWLF